MSSSIDETPWAPAPGRSVIDWSNETDTDLLNHTGRVVSDSRYNNMDIPNTATEITFIGDPSKVYTNFRMAICCFEQGQDLTIRFVNFNFTTNELILTVKKQRLSLYRRYYDLVKRRDVR